MRRTSDESLGRKPQEYADIARFSDDGFRQRGKQKNQELTELPLILNSDVCPIECLDAVEIHINKPIRLIDE